MVPYNRNQLAGDILRKAMLMSESEIAELFDRYSLDYTPSNDNIRFKMCAIIKALENEVATAQGERNDCRVRCRTLEEELNNG